MSKTIEANGQYTRKADGNKVEYDFTYPALDSLDDAIGELTEAEVLKLVQRMVKVDANNQAREKAKVANGDAERKPMSEAEKADAKVKRSENKRIVDLARSNPEIAELLKAKGINI